MPTDRFYLDRDNSGHWYVVPVARRAEWETWNNIDAEDEDAWEAPEFAQRVNGAFTRVTFTNPVIE